MRSTINGRAVRRAWTVVLFTSAVIAGGWVVAMPSGRAQVCVKVQVFTTSSTITADGTEDCEPKNIDDHDCFQVDGRPTVRVVACWPVVVATTR